MEFLIFLWDYVVPFLIILTVLVFVHELGHYWVARRSGVRVEVFSVGFGPEIYGWTDRNETRWKISAVPLGGYVKMFGEYDFEGGPEDQEPMTDEERAVSFHHKPLRHRTAIVAAGPLANFVFAIFVFGAIFGTVGSPHPLSAVGVVVADSAAEEAGLQPGDRILSIDSEPVAWFEDLRQVVSARPDVPLRIVVLRGGEEITINATPKRHMTTDEEGRPQEIGLLGVQPDPSQVGYERRDPLTAAWMGVEHAFGLTTAILNYLGEMIVGSQDADQLGGPLRIAQISGQMAQGGLVNLMFFMAALSVNLCLINLFPIPMLDGGHLAFYLLEAIRGRPLDYRVQEYGFRFGLILVLLIMIFATWNDLVHLKVFEFFKQLMT